MDSGFSGMAESSMNRPMFALTLPSDLRMLSVARTFVEAVCQACNFERSFLHALVLATGEAVTNIVRHAHREMPQAEMQILLEIRADGVVLDFLDQGRPFDIAAVPQLPPGELRIGGRGVFLLRTLMDEIASGPRSDCPGNRLRLFKRTSLDVKSAG
jgi:serine/threonine-protein kinase RsbW